jgi:rhodanese-related sulfurtransferase
MPDVDGSAIDRLLQEARSSLDRVTPAGLASVRAAGALIVDIRPVEQRERDGDLPGAVVIDRNVLEWRLDPSSPHRLPIVTGPEQRIVLVCNEGYSSSLAAHTLQLLGLVNATDLCGGYQALAQIRARPLEEPSAR